MVPLQILNKKGTNLQKKSFQNLLLSMAAMVSDDSQDIIDRIGNIAVELIRCISQSKQCLELKSLPVHSKNYPPPPSSCVVKQTNPQS